VAKIVADAYAWIEFFSGTAKGSFAKGRLEEAEAVITPDTVLAEVARKYLREEVKEERTRRRLSTILEASEPAYVDDDLAIEASRAYFHLQEKAKDEGLKKPSLFDALVLATARKNDAKVLTGDEHFRDLPETLWMGTGSSGPD
jgi:predicted nucleic acid-binding protein